MQAITQSLRLHRVGRSFTTSARASKVYSILAPNPPTRTALRSAPRHNISDLETTYRAHARYELRTYDVKPEHYPAFLNLTKVLEARCSSLCNIQEKIHMRFESSPAMGYWSTEFGGLNQVVHIWEYESLEARLAVRASLGANKKWGTEYMQKMLPMLDQQHNELLLPVSVNEPADQSQPGAFELRYTESTESKVENGELIGSFKTVVGGDTRGVQLIRYASVDEIPTSAEQRINNPEAEGGDLIESKILAPLPWSSMK